MFVLNASCALLFDNKNYAEYVFSINLINTIAAVSLMRVMDFKIGKYSKIFNAQDLLTAVLISIFCTCIIFFLLVFFGNLNLYLVFGVFSASSFILVSQKIIFFGKVEELFWLRMFRGLIISVGCFVIYVFEDFRSVDTVLLILILSGLPAIFYLLPISVNLRFFKALSKRKFLFKFCQRNIAYVIDMVQLPLVFYALMKFSVYLDPIFVKVIGLTVPIIGVLNQINAEQLRGRLINPLIIIQNFKYIFIIFLLVLLAVATQFGPLITLLFILVASWLTVPFSGFQILVRGNEFSDFLINLFILCVLIILLIAEYPFYMFLIALILKYQITFLIGFYKK